MIISDSSPTAGLQVLASSDAMQLPTELQAFVQEDWWEGWEKDERCSSLKGELFSVGVNGKRRNEMITHVSYIYIWYWIDILWKYHNIGLWSENIVAHSLIIHIVRSLVRSIPISCECRLRGSGLYESTMDYYSIQVDVFELYHLVSSYVLPHFSVATARIGISFLHPRPSTAPEALIQLRTKGTEVTLHNVGGRERNKKQEVPWSSISVWPAILSVLFDDIFLGVQSDDFNGPDWMCISMSIYI